MADAMVLVWSNRRGGWWRGNRHGYTTLIELAGRFPRAEAERIVADSDCGGRLFHTEVDNLTGIQHNVQPAVIVPAPEVCRCGVSGLESSGDPDVIVRAWCSKMAVDETAVEYAPWLADRQAAVDLSFLERVGDALNDLVAGSDADDGSLEDAAAIEDVEGCEPAPWETCRDGGTPDGTAGRG